MGSWAEVRALRQAGTLTATDARILGRSAFVERLLADSEATTRHTLRLRRPRPPLDALAQRIAVAAGVPVAELHAGRRTRAVSHTRRLLCQLAVRHLAYPGATVARLLGVTTSAVNRAAWSAPLPEVAAFTSVASAPTSPKYSGPSDQQAAPYAAICCLWALHNLYLEISVDDTEFSR